MSVLAMTLAGFIRAAGERVTGIKRKSQEECDREQVTGEGTWGSSLWVLYAMGSRAPQLMPAGGRQAGHLSCDPILHRLPSAPTVSAL